jgi:hypothetical protein
MFLPTLIIYLGIVFAYLHILKGFLKFFIHLFMCAYIVWAISPPCPHYLPLPPTLTPLLPETILPFSPILSKRGHSKNKKDKVFWLVEIRITIQRDSQHCFHVQVYYNPMLLVPSEYD